MTKVYVSGPMTGLPMFNFDAFDSMTATLEDWGWEVVSPAEHDREELLKRGWDRAEDVPGFPEGDVATYTAAVEGMSFEELLAWDFQQIIECDGIVMLPGWEASTGAKHERYVAEALGKTVWLASRVDTLTMRWVLEQVEPVLVPLLKDAVAQQYAQEADEVQVIVAGEHHPWPCDASHCDECNDAWLGRRSKVLPVRPENLTNEVRVVNEATGGEKGQKLARFDLIPPGPLTLLAEHYGRGSRKYADRNWERGYDWGLSFGALNRHLWAFWSGEDIDAETGSPHMVAVAWHALTLLEFMVTHPELDTRSSTEWAARVLAAGGDA